MRTEAYKTVDETISKQIAAGVMNEDVLKPWREREPRNASEAFDALLENMSGIVLTKGPKHDTSRGQRNLEIEAFLAKINPDIRAHREAACYTPADDVISLPTISQFQSPEMYYRILFHELAHWTGHEDRLNRMDGNTLALRRFHGTRDAFREFLIEEEFVAEMCSAYLSQHFGLPLSDRHASYIGHHFRGHPNPKPALEEAKVKAKAAFEYLLEKAGMKA